MSRLRLDLIVRSYPDLHIGEGDDPDMTWTAVDRWTWRLWSGSRIVSSSGGQEFSRRIDCARGVEVGAGFHDVVSSRCTFAWRPDYVDGSPIEAEVRILDERTQ